MSSGDAAGTKTYAFDNAAEQAPARFDALSALFDTNTIRHLETRGVAPGWRCLDVGAGGGSIALWLSDRVGPSGHVVATDIDTSHLANLETPNLTVLQHNIVSDPPPKPAFDLVHTRLVLVHVPERELALQRMIETLKPGGWLLLEEFDSLSMPASHSVNPAETELRLIPAIQQVLTGHGADVRYGRLLPGRLRAHGLIDVGAEGYVQVWQGGSVGAALFRTNALHVRDEILNLALMTEAEFERDLALLGDPSITFPSSVMWSVWGRRP